MFIDSYEPRQLALQRSAMFSGTNTWEICFAPSERGNLLEHLFYKHFVPTGRGSQN
jgi:hypothetical protein